MLSFCQWDQTLPGRMQGDSVQTQDMDPMHQYTDQNAWYASVSVQEMWCCAVSRLRVNQTLIANNIVDFVSMCFTFQMDPDFAREALVRSFVNPFPGFTRCGGNPGWNPWRPCASIQEMWSKHNFILFSGPLCLQLFLRISGVCWISTLSEDYPSMLTQQRGFSKFSGFLPVWWLSYWTRTHENQIS